MRISNVLAGFTLGEADVLRKAMGKKKADVMATMRKKFVDGARSRGTSEKKAGGIFDLMEHFAGYGFNKSHSTTYALLAYQTAYLKANYPWHFMASLLTTESQNTEKLALYLGECREMGIPVLPPDVNRSEWAFTVTSEGIRYGLGAVKGAGEAAIASVIEARAAGPIRSLFTLCERLDLRLVNRRVLESLVKAGALDSLGLTNGERVAVPSLRARLFAAIERACEHGSRSQRDRDEGQAQLFGGSADEDEEAAERGLEWALPEVSPWTEPQQLAGEKEVLGLYLSGHPVERFARELKTLGARTTAELSYTDGDWSRRRRVHRG
jgi:DNA polymerase-3 subunit alpha